MSTHDATIINILYNFFLRAAEEADANRVGEAAAAAAQAAADARRDDRGDDGCSPEVVHAIGDAISGVIHSATDQDDQEEDDEVDMYHLADADIACEEAMDMIRDINTREQDLVLGCIRSGKTRGRCVW